MSEPKNKDAESTPSEVSQKIFWPLSDRVEELEQTVTYLLEGQKNTLDHLSKVLVAIEEIFKDGSEE